MNCVQSVVGQLELQAACLDSCDTRLDDWTLMIAYDSLTSSHWQHQRYEDAGTNTQADP